MEKSAPFIQGGGNMFEINGITWEIQWVNPNNKNLIRSDGTLTVGMTDWNSRCVYLSNNLKGAFLRRVMAHELCHCFCFSYDLYMPIEKEERLADWISLYGTDLVYLLDDLMNMELRKAYIA